ncbi:hypothetical protein [Streptomyces adustus]
MSPGKQASQGETAPAMVAGARLEAMRRCVRLSRVAVWTLIAAGPVALAVAVTSAPGEAEAAAVHRPAAMRTVAAAADPSGYAQVFLGAWLRSSAEDATSAQARLAQTMAPDVELPGPAAGARSAPESLMVVRSAQRADGVWSVTVVAQYADGRLRYYAVPATADRKGSSFAVTGAPGVVAGPTCRRRRTA